MAEFDAFKVPGEYRTTCHAHNDFVNFAVHTGLPGLALLGLTLVTAIRKGLSNYVRTSPGAGRWVPAALLAGLVAILVSGLFQCNLTDSEIAIQAWLIIGSIALLARLSMSQPEATA
jgi:O-antigen ligase